MVAILQGFGIVLFVNLTKVDVVVDTISRKDYCHNLLNHQEQPLNRKKNSKTTTLHEDFVRLILEVVHYNLFPIVKVQPSLDLLNAIQDLDIGV
jgi:hypothetical protein